MGLTQFEMSMREPREDPRRQALHGQLCIPKERTRLETATLSLDGVNPGVGISSVEQRLLQRLSPGTSNIKRSEGREGTFSLED